MKDLIIPIGNQQITLAFVAGTPAGEPFLLGDERAIYIPDFYIAKTPVTQAQWLTIMGNNPSQYHKEENPVEHVSWYDAQAFIERLNRSFRLPTETEWEYAARGGRKWRDGFRFAGTNNMAESGWYEGNAGPYTAVL